jgi:hypothetical protein
MHKKDAHGADQLMFNAMGKMPLISNAFIVFGAIEHLSGR